jgi:putative endonuclease
MYYVYVLRSKQDGKFYVGYTADLVKRMEDHNKGVVQSTRNRRPLELIYYEACAKQQDALHREKYLKTAYGKRYLRNRLKEYLDALR